MRSTRWLIGLCLATGLAVCPAAGSDLRDLYFGEALYHAFQGEYFDALQRLDTELAMYRGLDQPELDTLHYHINNAEFSVGDFELNYRMHHRAGRAIKAVLEGAVDEAVRNEAAFRLARIHFQKGQFDDALHALERIQGTVPQEIRNDVEFLRANIYMAIGRPSEAVNVLKQLRGDESLAGFVAYNLGIALLQDGRPQEAIEQLDKAGQLPAGDPAGLAIRDKSNLVLGTILFESGNLERAKQSLDRVRLEGPFSDQALLRAGWAEASAKQYDRALVPWNILAAREPTDVAVQEAMLAVPHSYSSLNLHGRAALTYGRALDAFSSQIQRVDASISSIREGRFLKALIREETRQNEDWVISLRSLPDSPETYYLMELMASHDFQTALHNYLDLEDLRSRLIAWRTSLDAFVDLIQLRGQNYEPLLPEVDAQFRELDSRMHLRLEQRKHLAKRLQAMLTAPRPDYLATAEERSAGERIALIEKQLGDSDRPEALALRQRAARLQGMLTWRVETEYNDRLTAAQVHLNELNSEVDALTRQHESFVRTRQATTQSYVGYDKQIARLRQRVGDASQRVDLLMARQGHLIETVAINQLEARRKRLVAQQTEARYGVAASYDRAARAQSGAGRELMRRLTIPMVLGLAFIVGCAARAKKQTVGTLAELHDVRPDVQEVKVEHGLDQALEHYRQFVDETPQTTMTPEAMRRLADLQIEKQFGLRGVDAKPREMAAPEHAQPRNVAQANKPNPDAMVASAAARESAQDFERRTTAEGALPASNNADASPTDAMRAGADPKGPLEAIALYDRLLTEYPNYEHRDKVLYQKARAYDELGRTEEAIDTMERLIRENPNSEHYDEVQFRRGEYFFTRRRYRDAESAYSAAVSLGTSSSYYELALYKLGWTFYKQDLYDEALDKYMALLDYKVSVGYDFDKKHEEEDERRVSDTFRVISLSFSNLGGPEAVGKYYSTFGNRSYEDRVYSNLGEHYLAELRYQDAAKTYKAFVALYPFHRAAPHFSMRIIETFTQGGFPKLVLESKREFASKYGLQAEYWQHFKPEEWPQVLAYLKTNLKDLATHYHAQYQSTQEAGEKVANYHEARRWYGAYLDSFPTDSESPPINYQLADLLLENHDFGDAAKQYERTAYGYPSHPRSADAGYAAVYAYREQLKTASAEQQGVVKRNTVESSLKFANAFPDHEHAAEVLGAAADDMYEMKDYRPAIEAAQRVVDRYPGAQVAIRRSAWIVIAHGSFELAEYPQAEHGYAQVLAVTPDGDKSRAALVDNLAASIYKQGELANQAQDYRAAADHFLRIRSAAPTSSIRPAAEYDAGTALIRLKDWAPAVSVLEQFRNTFPDHKLRLEADKQIAYAYRENGQLSNAAVEYDRIASKSDDPALRSEALLVAGDLYEKSNARDRALDAYVRYVKEFPRPLETALETRLKIAEMYKAAHDESRYHQELKEIVRIDADAGSDRTARTRTLAARSALVLAELIYQDFMAVKLRQPFEISLKEKQQRMEVTIAAMGQLVNYEIADVTAAATYYLAETYFDFSRSLVESERPTNLKPAELKEFELALDEQAFPFEEKAIGVHEKNMELLRAGVFNQWTEKSLGRLTELMPGRYAKPEMSSGFLTAIDSYVYRSPLSQVPGPTSGNADTRSSEPGQTTHPTAEPVDKGVVKHATPQ